MYMLNDVTLISIFSCNNQAGEAATLSLLSYCTSYLGHNNMHDTK